MHDDICMMEYDELIHCHFNTQKSKRIYQYYLEYLLLGKKMILLTITLFSLTCTHFHSWVGCPYFKKVLMYALGRHLPSKRGNHFMLGQIMREIF